MLKITPLVSLEPPGGLVLEVGGSLKLWGGLGSIKQALNRELDRCRLTAHLCAAPTALAALWLARDGREDVLSAKRLSGWLGTLPLRVTGWPQATRRLLQKMGLDTVGDCLRLPRDGLVRRVGQRCLDDLDRSLGRQPDLRTAFRPDRRFSSVVEFQEEVAEPQVIADAGKRLILRLAEALHGHQAQIASCRYGFRHSRQPATMVRIGQVVPTHESRKIIDLFLTRLETLSLPAPVTALSLTTGKITPMTGLNAGLFPACPEMTPQTALGELIARLRTRFSAEDIHGLGLAENHRPEAAWSRVRDPWAGSAAAGGGTPGHRGGLPAGRHPARQVTASGCPKRPLWLLPMPVSVTAADRKWGRLRMESGPERIEAGWWEGLDTSRDYYVARGSRGRRLWVFRDRRSNRGDWYLHGIFG
ncbi:MAG: DNA polymerase Y family protein [Rhodospirillaceae bacterium]|nr:DNA polymerase Y family protein [Rhodospirillaceae bacterium]